ncbi:MAG TPA: cyclic nucleotide-binding domain-containing protein, partial [Acidimicrobiales bacterium]|nr:cyclic nucleotide-binding domain-containing protein [Acidimicrobiales bacterium]
MARTEVGPFDGVLDGSLVELDFVALRQVPFVALVPDELRTLVLHMFRKETFAFGEEICREGEVPHSLYVLGSGSARVVTRHGDAEVMLAKVTPGELFGEDALIESDRRVETVRASEDVTVYRLAREAFDALADEVPAIAEALRRHVRLEEIRRTLRMQPAFATIQLSVLSRFFEGFEVVTLHAHETIVSQGSPSDGVYVVARGTLAVVREDDTLVGYLRSGDCFGERAALTDHVTDASVVAQSDVEVIRVSNSVLRELMDASPRFAGRMREMADLASTGPAVPLEEPTSAPSEPAALSATDAAIAQGSAPLRTTSHPTRRARRFPFVAQFDESDCGVACLAMVSRHFGRKVSTAFLRDAAGTGVQGTSLTGITQAGRAAGLAVEPVHASAERLDEYQLPAIVHYKGNHWIVLYEVTPTHVYVADPAIGLRQLAREDFERDWTGYAAFVSRTNALDEAPIDNLALGWLVPFLLEQRAALVFSLVLALALAGCEVGVPVVINSLVNSLTSHNALSSVNGAGLALLGLVIAGLAISFVANRVIVKVTIGFDTHSLDFLTGKLLHLPMSYVARRKIGDLERRISGMRMIRTLLIQDGVTAGTNILLLIVAIVMMLVYSWVLGLVFLAVLPLYGAVMWYSKTKLRPIFASAEEA